MALPWFASPVETSLAALLVYWTRWSAREFTFTQAALSPCYMSELSGVSLLNCRREYVPFTRLEPRERNILAVRDTARLPGMR